MCFTLISKSQDNSFNIGDGLNITANNGDYKFILSGIIEPQIQYFTHDSESELYLNSKLNVMNFFGSAKNEKVSFFMQTDFTNTNPLVDAWVAIDINNFLKIKMGQSINPSNNREMTFQLGRESFNFKSLLSSEYSMSGREFGLFLDSYFNLFNIFFHPQFALTSGDGINSFGVNSVDEDLGGVKYGFRLDIYPFGKKNTLFNQLADLNNSKFNFILGFAGSYNVGASHYNGEGHGDVSLYNSSGDLKLPDYRKIYSDIFLKYNGFSLLAEYGISSANVTNFTYLDQNGINLLVPTQISEFYKLGSGYNLNLSYTTKNGLGFNLRKSTIKPQFETNNNSLTQESTLNSISFIKYVKGNDLKLQIGYTFGDYENSDKHSYMSTSLQLTF